jgi:hypothetical protein
MMLAKGIFRGSTGRDTRRGWRRHRTDEAPKILTRSATAGGDMESRRLTEDDVRERHPEELAAAVAYLVRRGVTAREAIRWRYDTRVVGRLADGRPEVSCFLIGEIDEERVSVHLSTSVG